MENFEEADKIVRREKFLSVRKEFLQSFLFLALCLAGLGWLASGYAQQKESWYSDTETLIQVEGMTQFEGKGLNFSGGERVSTTYAHSGAHSMHLSPDTPYGFQTLVSKLTGRERFTVRVWRYGPDPRAKGAALVVEVVGLIRGESRTSIQSSPDGWESLEVQLEMDCRTEGRDLKVYCWNPTGVDVYWDDISVEMERRALWEE